MLVTAQMPLSRACTICNAGGELSKQMIGRIVRSVREAWGSLDELREVAVGRGFTPDQFGHAIDTVGCNPHHVANELQRHLLMAALYVGQAEAA